MAWMLELPIAPTSCSKMAHQQTGAQCTAEAPLFLRSTEKVCCCQLVERRSNWRGKPFLRFHDMEKSKTQWFWDSLVEIMKKLAGTTFPSSGQEKLAGVGRALKIEKTYQQLGA